MRNAHVLLSTRAESHRCPYAAADMAMAVISVAMSLMFILLSILTALAVLRHLRCPVLFFWQLYDVEVCVEPRYLIFPFQLWR